MTEIEKSSKLIFNEFQRAISEVPLEVFYQNFPSDQYTASGFQFNIKSPGTNALLDCDIWIKYEFQIIETVALAITNMFEQEGVNINPQSMNRLAFRGGNIFWRAIQNFSVQINNQTLTVQPYQWCDVLNRIYISNDQSEHEFSASGGRFDEGNHGLRVSHDVKYGPLVAGENTSLALGVFVVMDTGHLNNVWLHDVWSTNGTGGGNVNNLYCNMRPQFPVRYEFYNPGFDRRFDQFAYKLRTDWPTAANNAANAAVSIQFASDQVGGMYRYTIVVYERLPIPLFKMYSNDGNYGVIPNIQQMVIQGNFISQMFANMFRSTVAAPNVALYWPADITNTKCRIFLRWFTPPVSMQIPREISVPYHKINLWSKAVTLTALVAASKTVEITLVSEYNITLEAIPDLLLIYLKIMPAFYNCNIPDDYNLEIQDLIINIDNASGKLNQIQTIDLYQKWKKIIKHQDTKIIGYDEWRKYCCVAALQPEDYGVRYGPGYSNQTVLGIQFKAVDYHNNPRIMLAGEETVLQGGTLQGELCVVSIYNKNRLIIRADGTAQQELTRIAADFNLIQGNMPGVGMESQIQGRLI